MTPLICELVAGAAGVTALNAVTYLDMAARGRPPSKTPEESVRRLAEVARVPLGDGDRADHRVAGLAQLLGIATGVASAMLYHRSIRRELRWPAATVALASFAMLGSNAPMTALRVTDLRDWGAKAWLADVVPHLAYGAAAAAAFSISGRQRSPRLRRPRLGSARA